METLHFQVRMHVILGIKLILFAGIISCMQTSPFQVSSTLRATQCLEKYIAESYFEKHDCLRDSYFQDFRAHGMALGSCDLPKDKLNHVLRLPHLKRRLIGEGSHRRLSTSAMLKIETEHQYELPAHCCVAIVVERLPSGVFADPFELQHLHLGVSSDAAVFGDTNIELPAVQSNRSIVEVHMDIGHNILSRQQFELEIRIEVPLHARYQPLGDGFSNVKFGQPDIFMCCSTEKLQNESCLFMVENSSVFKEGAVVWEIPCGIRVHSQVVSVVTFISAIVLALLIVFTSIYSLKTTGCKQS